MAYDGSGRRISKTRMKKTAFEGHWYADHATHYTGIGSEIRKEYHNGELQSTKVVVNMPQGLGRYGIENADGMDKGDEFYLKNHLGSTMMVAQVSSTNASEPAKVAAAYDYRAFGEQVSLAKSADKVTENFTGKELDDETELDYFGARYLDPMLGMWISVDPKRQFASPYLYAGNGYNPVNVVDPDGNAAIIDKDDNFVDVTIPVIYDGDAATYENIQTLQQEFLDIFVNEFDQYDVNVNFVTYNPDVHGKVYNYVYLSNSPVGDKCPGSPGGCAGTGSLPGYAYIHFGDESARVHELAHLLGLDDKYYQVDMFGKYFKAFDGYENNLMGSHGAKGIKPTQIEEMWGPGLHSKTRRNGYRANTINGL
jgi:RHS repeat-associated protein